MKHTVQVGKPIKKGDKIVGYKDIETIPSNQAFNYNRRGYKTLQPGDLEAVGQGDESDQSAKEQVKAPEKKASKKTAKKKASKKTAKKKASKKTAKKKASKKKTGK